MFTTTRLGTRRREKGRASRLLLMLMVVTCFLSQDPFSATALTVETISPLPRREVIVAPTFTSSVLRITLEVLSIVMLYPLASVLSGLTEFKLRLSVCRLDRRKANTERSDCSKLPRLAVRRI